MSIQVKKVGDTIISKSVIPATKAMTMIQANTRIQQLEAELKKTQSPENDSAIVQRLSSITWDMSPRTNAPQQSERSRQTNNLKDRYLADCQKNIDKKRATAKASYGMFPDKVKLDTELAQIDREQVALDKEKVLFTDFKPIGFGNDGAYVEPNYDARTRALTDGKNFYYLPKLEYYIARLKDGRVVVKQSGELSYRLMVQDTKPVADPRALGVVSYPDLTEQMFRQILEAKPTYKQLCDAFKVVGIRGIVLEGTDAEVLW